MARTHQQLNVQHPSLQHPFFDPLRRGNVIALAHRGGALLEANRGIENTLAAFGNAVDLGYRYLETDVHASRDGVLYAFHDHSLGRLTASRARISQLLSHDIDRVLIADREPIPRLNEVLDTFADCFFSIDIKADNAVEPIIAAASTKTDRLCLGSFSHWRISQVRRRVPGALTACSRQEIVAQMSGAANRRAAKQTPEQDRTIEPRVFSIPTHYGPIPIAHGAFVRRANYLHNPVMAWTINNPATMRYLIDIGITGIFTDRPDVLKDILRQRGKWDGASSEGEETRGATAARKARR